MKLVIFDCDGTLVDSHNKIVATLEQAFAALGLAAPTRADMRGVIGLSLPEMFMALVPACDASTHAELVRRYRFGFHDAPLAPSQDPLYPGVGEVIAELAQRQDVVLGIATGKSKRGVARLIEREGWRGCFFTIQTADDHPSKPHPSMVLQAMAEAGVEPAATVVVGDSVYDMQMACNAGVGAIGVAWGYCAPERLRLAGAEAVATTCASLIATIDAQLAAHSVRVEAGKANA